MNTLSTMVDIAKQAGLFMLGSSDTESTVKSNMKDFTTVADIKAQAILRDRLLEIEPDALVLSEEDPEEMRAAMYDPKFTGYILDPIDGTYSFKRDMKESAISIGFIENGLSVRGVVYDPFKGELYTAEKGHGSFRNGKAINVSTQDAIEGSSIATSNSYDDDAMVRNLKRHIAIYNATGYMPWTSCPGSGVLIMSNIACGRFDAYHHNGLKPWDNAAAFLIVEEAGGKVCKLNGEPAVFTDNAVIVGNPAVVAILISVFRSVDAALLF